MKNSPMTINTNAYRFIWIQLNHVIKAVFFSFKLKLQIKNLCARTNGTKIVHVNWILPEMKNKKNRSINMQRKWKGVVVQEKEGEKKLCGEMAMEMRCALKMRLCRLEVSIFFFFFPPLNRQNRSRLIEWFWHENSSQ